MKKVVLLVLFVLVGAALASEPTGGQSWIVSEGDDTSVALCETITVNIPVRYALHLTDTLWQLDLNNPPAGVDYTFDSSNWEAPEDGCYLVPKTVTNGDELRDYLIEGLTLKGIDSYPAIEDFNDDGVIEETEKGTLICVHHKTLQKFSNDPDGWKLLITVTGEPTSGFGYFGMADHVLPAGSWSYFYTNDLDAYPVTDVQVAGAEDATTGGWLDDDIVEAFWFDGTEAAGDYVLTVTFTLAGL